MTDKKRPTRLSHRKNVQLNQKVRNVMATPAGLELHRKNKQLPHSGTVQAPMESFGFSLMKSHRDRAVRRIRRLFDSRVNSWGFGARNVSGGYEAMADAWLAGEFTIKPHVVWRAVLETANRARAQRYSQSRGEGGLSHCWLKEIGLAWLQVEFGTIAQRELRECDGFKYDLGLPDQQVVLECGNTSIQAAFAMLHPPAWRYFLLPFSAAADRWYELDGSPHVFIFEFVGVRHE